jgi:hypothetical protein
MGVERQTAKLNWLTSFGMIVMAGTLYRVRKVTKHMSSSRVKDLMIKYGFVAEPTNHNIIVGRPINTQAGEWEIIESSRKKYALLYSAYKFL